MARSKFGSITLLQLVIGVYLLVTGIQGILVYNSEINQVFNVVKDAFGDASGMLLLIISICQIVSGALMILMIFFPFSNQLGKLVKLLITLFWGAFVVYKSIISGININNAGIHFSPDFIGWLSGLSLNLIILLAIWNTNRQTE